MVAAAAAAVSVAAETAAAEMEGLQYQMEYQET
jgi:hypothetical protein